MKDHLDIEPIDNNKITDEFIALVNAMAESFGQESQRDAEQKIFATFGVSPKTQGRWKTELRKMFAIPSGTPISVIAKHPQLRQALETILTRQERSDKMQLRGGKKIDVIMPTGELVSIETFLKSLYPNENVNAVSCYRALVARCKNKKVVREDLSEATLADLPSQVAVVRFLRQWRQEFIAVRRARSRQKDWEKNQQMFVSRNIDQYGVDEVWISDHTELDFLVCDEEGKIRRRWITSFKDLRSGVWRGYHLSWQPNSDTIALAFRNAVFGKQLYALVNGQYKSCGYITVCDTVWMDNGKDYRSKYTKQVFGKTDFNDAARKSVVRITNLHYTQPYHGQSKAQQERGFGVLQTLLKSLPGYKGNIARLNQPDSLKEDLKQGNILSVTEFDKMIELGINVLNNRITKTLGEETPMQYLLSHQRVQRAIDLRVLDFLMMRSENKAIDRCQVRVNNIYYYSDQLMAFNKKRADVYFDPQDMGFVSVYVDGEFAAVAVNKEMIGKDERGWQNILADRARSEKTMREEIKTYRNGISKADARMMLLHGELMNTSSVDAALLHKEHQAVILRTGFEEQAKERHDALEEEKQVVEIDMVKRSKKIQPFTSDMLANIK